MDMLVHNVQIKEIDIVDGAYTCIVKLLPVVGKDFTFLRAENFQIEPRPDVRESEAHDKVLVCAGLEI